MEITEEKLKELQEVLSRKQMGFLFAAVFGKLGGAGGRRVGGLASDIKAATAASPQAIATRALNKAIIRKVGGKVLARGSAGDFRAAKIPDSPLFTGISRTGGRRLSDVNAVLAMNPAVAARRAWNKIVGRKVISKVTIRGKKK